MTYQVFHFDKNNEILLAQLSILGFDSFEEKDESLAGYVDRHSVSESFVEEVKRIALAHDCEFLREDLEEKNWNEEWESSFKPVIVEEFCAIKATFHKEELPETTYTILVDPKMAFGTGHHETTFMMIKTMKRLLISGKSVIDYGCGTGILSILASKMAAARVDAIDYDINSYENTLENIALNNCKRIKTYHGELLLLENNSYDVILANINRNVLLEHVAILYRMLKKGGDILLSGILEEDKDLVRSAYQAVGFLIENQAQKGKWLCFHLKK